MLEATQLSYKGGRGIQNTGSHAKLSLIFLYLDHVGTGLGPTQLLPEGRLGSVTASSFSPHNNDGVSPHCMGFNCQMCPQKKQILSSSITKSENSPHEQICRF